MNKLLAAFIAAAALTASSAFAKSENRINYPICDYEEGTLTGKPANAPLPAAKKYCERLYTLKTASLKKLHDIREESENRQQEAKDRFKALAYEAKLYLEQNRHPTNTDAISLLSPNKLHKLGPQQLKDIEISAASYAGAIFIYQELIAAAEETEQQENSLFIKTKETVDKIQEEYRREVQKAQALHPQ